MAAHFVRLLRPRHASWRAANTDRTRLTQLGNRSAAGAYTGILKGDAIRVISTQGKQVRGVSDYRSGKHF